jgi:hypothetical protein
MTLEEEARFWEISCLRVLRFLLAYILEFVLTYVRAFLPILETPTLAPTVVLHETKLHELP